MKTLNKSLNCLIHPSVLASIALLVLNDHLLKTAYPSWLTGKLSDFAGLFFFPFLLAASLSILLNSAQISSRTIGLIAFGITGVWFALMKATVWGNALTEDLLSLLFGLPVQIAFDPTDLVALIALLPAWRLWTREQVGQPRRAAWIALGIATLASIATSPPPPAPRVVRVISTDGGTLYAGINSFSGYDLTHLSAPGQVMSAVESNNGGLVWSEISHIPRDLGRQVTYPLILCHPNNSSICYRISQPEQIEQSADGGQTWQSVWNVPWGRKGFMNKYNCPGLGCKKNPGLDLGPYDMSFVKNQNGSYSLIIAMGTEGVLMRTFEGRWEQRSVAYIEPTPFAVSNPLEGLAFLIFWEGVLLVPIGIVLFFMLNLLGPRSILNNLGVESSGKDIKSWALRPMLFPMILLGVLVSITLSIVFGFPVRISYQTELANIVNIFVQLELYILPFLIFVATPIGIFLSWRRVASLASDRRRVWECAGWTALASIAIFPVLLGSLILWTMGIIPWYELALGLGVVATLRLWVIANRGFQKASLLAAATMTPGIDSQQKSQVI